MDGLYTPVGLAALIIGVVGVIVREIKDRPRIKRIEEDRAVDRADIKELREANAGLRAMVSERIDFTAAIMAMADMVKVVKEGIESGHALRGITIERMEAHSRATTEEHTAIVSTLREQTGVLKEIKEYLRRPSSRGEKGERGEKGDHGQDAGKGGL